MGACPLRRHALRPAGQCGLDEGGHHRGVGVPRRLQRPVLLVIYTDWCPHCKEFETQFEDQQVAELAQRFVMARGNSDEMDVLDRSYAPDGRYIPRMLVLSPTGKLDTELNDGGEDAYYWGSTSPKGILRAMRKAIKKYGN